MATTLFNAHHLYGHLVSARGCVVEGREPRAVHGERGTTTQVAQQMSHTAAQNKLMARYSEHIRVTVYSMNNYLSIIVFVVFYCLFIVYHSLSIIVVVYVVFCLFIVDHSLGITVVIIYCFFLFVVCLLFTTHLASLELFMLFFFGLFIVYHSLGITVVTVYCLCCLLSVYCLPLTWHHCSHCLLFMLFVVCLPLTWHHCQQQLHSGEGSGSACQ